MSFHKLFHVVFALLLIFTPLASPQSPNSQIPRINTWRDPATGLVWTQQDNGFPVTWKEAVSYCQSLTADGHSGWRLGEFPEVRSLWDPTANVNDRHIKGEIEISAGGDFVWTNTPGNGQGTGFLVEFQSGYWSSAYL